MTVLALTNAFLNALRKGLPSGPILGIQLVSGEHSAHGNGLDISTSPLLFNIKEFMAS